MEKRPKNAKLAEWKIEHTQRLAAAIKLYESLGWRCDVERYIRVKGETAIVAGKVDLITRMDGQRPVIRDCKRSERDSDIAQVASYMVLVPLAWRAHSMIFAGEVLYPTHSVSVPPHTAETMKPKLFALIKRLATCERPQTRPSLTSCRFCEVNCEDRWDDATDAETDAF